MLEWVTDIFLLFVCAMPLYVLFCVLHIDQGAVEYRILSQLRVLDQTAENNMGCPYALEFSFRRSYFVKSVLPQELLVDGGF